MGIGGLGWWEAIRRFFQWLIGTYVEYKRKEKARLEKEKEAISKYIKAEKEGDAQGMLNAFEELKRTRNE